MNKTSKMKVKLNYFTYQVKENVSLDVSHEVQV